MAFSTGMGVGAGGGVDDEQGFVGGLWVFAGEDAPDFPQFFHQIVACVEAAGGIADEEVESFASGAVMGLEADGGGIGLVVSFDDGYVEAGGPCFQLFNGGGAERIGGGEQDPVALTLQQVG